MPEPGAVSGPRHGGQLTQTGDPRYIGVGLSTLIKRKIKFYSYIRKFRRDGAKVIYDD